MGTPLFSDIVTIYNHIRLGRSDRWLRTVLRGVQVQQKNLNSFGATGESRYLTETSITIPICAKTGGKVYAAPEIFAAAEKPETLWTLSPADGLDLVVLGECDREIGESYSADDLIREFKAVTLSTATDNTRRSALRHWRARCV